jgi:hypothetical protein
LNKLLKMDDTKQKVVKIASGQGFWGDLPTAPLKQVRSGEIDYLMMDYLAEVTMSIMQKQKLRNPAHGYARDFVEVIEELLPEIAAGKVKILSNAGGVNPVQCAKVINEIAKSKGYNISLAVVHGDDILDQLDVLIDNGHELSNMENGAPIKSIKDELFSANVYFGAAPMVEALKSGAQVVVTGRVTDTGLCLAPLIHEFGWSFDDFDKMSAGTIAGHILECGAQSSGGNYTDWKRVGDFTDIGFPLIEANSDGTFIVTKHDSLDGFVHSSTIKEQLLYEIGDPQNYITPDCIADFTSITVDDVGKNRVKISGIKGFPATPYFKVSASYGDGFKLTSNLTFCWPDALEKASLAYEILKKRSDKLNLEIDNFHADFIGYNGCSEIPVELNAETRDLPEIQLRFSAMSNSQESLDRLGKEIAPLILTGPSGVTGFAGGRPKASEIVAYWPALIKKSAVKPIIEFFN